jgi:hypothetical protein
LELFCRSQRKGRPEIGISKSETISEFETCNDRTTGLDGFESRIWVIRICFEVWMSIL